MILYKDNPDLGIKVIELPNGEKEYRTNCTKIKNEFYVKNVEAFFAGNKWYKKDSGLIIFDHETSTWGLEDRKYELIRGIIGFREDGVPELGYFSGNPYNNVGTSSRRYGGFHALNSDLMANNGYVEDISTGIWYPKNECTAATLRSYNEITNKVNHENKGHDIEDNKNEMLRKINYYNKFDVNLTKDVRRCARFLNGATFGLEAECSYGNIPDNIQNRLGVVICRDGSLRDENNKCGPEFTTIPLSGAKGLQNIVNLSNELKKRTLISEKGSLHIHLGNLPTSRLFLVSLYVLSYKIQDEIFSMFPYYKTDYTLANKEKDYCKKLKKMNMGILPLSANKEAYEQYVNNNYEKLFYWLSQNENGTGYMASKEWNRGKHAHPVSQKWHRPNRYYWINLMNVLFSSRNTVEFRIHTPTTNSQKMINWLFICNAIVRYSMLHAKSILSNNKKITLDDVLDYYKNTFNSPQAVLLSDYLKAYVGERKAKFKADFLKKDYLSKTEITEDKTYRFQYNNISDLF